MTLTGNLRIDIDRLMGRLMALGQVGALAGGGVCRLALGSADRAGRDLVVSWMKERGLAVTVDRIGNVVGVRAGQEAASAVMTGSHIDTVATGGLYDGNLGVLAGLEVMACLDDAGIITKRPLAVGFFTNEEGARFAPDMMGSAVHQGSLALDDALAAKDRDGESVGTALAGIGYAGAEPVGDFRAHCFFELHVEQGPVLEEEGIAIGAVTGVQGISWTEYLIKGVSNHAGTTPLRLRHDAGYVAAALSVEARRLAKEMGANQVATVGVTKLHPDLINVIAKEAVATLDLRNTDDALLKAAEARMAAFMEDLAQCEGVAIESRVLARFAPVEFDPRMVDLVEATAGGLGLSVKRMPSGAGHDAQMFAPNCPTAMIFVPSKDGISHNVEEFTSQPEVEAGANVLLQAMLAKANE
jgi:N-carbamoyl-L-amino-acid hydrolase